MSYLEENEIILPRFFTNESTCLQKTLDILAGNFIGHPPLTRDFYLLNLVDERSSLIDAINQIVDQVIEDPEKQDELLTQTYGYCSLIPLGDILSTLH